MIINTKKRLQIKNKIIRGIFIAIFLLAIIAVTFFADIVPTDIILNPIEDVDPQIIRTVQNRAELETEIAFANTAGEPVYIVLLNNLSYIGTPHTAIVIGEYADVTLISEDDEQFSFSVDSTSQRHFVVHGTLRIGNVTLAGNSPATTVAHGGIDVEEDGRLLLRDESVIANNRWGSGGGVHIADGGLLVIYGGTISGNVAMSTSSNTGGGGVNAVGEDSKVYLLSGAISGNTTLGAAATVGGGGIRISGGEFTMAGGEISGNWTPTNGPGGGAHLISATFIMSGGEISDNWTGGAGRIGGGDGGGVHVAGRYGSIELSGTALIARNEAGQGGGFNLNITTADVEQGGIHPFTMSGNSRIENNHARTAGGGMRLSGYEVTMEDNAAIYNNTANTAGGGIHFASHPHSRLFIYDNASISSNASNANGGGINMTGGRTYLRGGEISGNRTRVNGNGGGIHVEGGATWFTMTGGEISDNWTSGIGNGGGIHSATAGGTGNLHFSISGGEISGNHTSSGHGGGIFLYARRLVMTNMTVSGNWTGGSGAGGGLHLTSSVANVTPFAITGSVISGNRTGGSGAGGGIHLTNTGANAQFPLTGSEISGNWTGGSGNGGGAFLSGVQFTMTDSEITDNWTGGSARTGTGNGGGAQILGAGSALTLSGTNLIARNEANQGGGFNLDLTESQAATAHHFIMNGGRVENNTARTNGGGLRNSGFHITMIGTVVHENQAGHQGGGIHFASNPHSRLFMYTGTVISENISGTVAEDPPAPITSYARHGGGLSLTGGRTYLRGGEISGNTASTHPDAEAGRGGGVNLRGGAAFIVGTPDGLVGGTIYNNRAFAGGGISIFETATSNVVFHYGLIDYNHSLEQGGAVNVNIGTFTMHNGIIERNTSGTHGGAIRLSGASTVTLHAGYVRDNTASGNGGAIHAGAALNNDLYIGEDLYILRNTANGSDGGGGINFTGGRIVVRGTVSYNRAYNGDGGGVNIAGGHITVGGVSTFPIQAVTIDGASINHNFSVNAGGGLGVERAIVNVLIQYTEILYNRADDRGGGIRFGLTGPRNSDTSEGAVRYPGVITLGNEVTIRGNTTAGPGGGIFVGSSFVNYMYINDGVMIYNNSANDGGGIYIRGGYVTMNGGIIGHDTPQYANTAVRNGGGINFNVAHGVLPGKFTMNGGAIAGNTAGGTGGGLHAHGANVGDIVTIDGGVIRYNTASNGGGFSLRNATAILRNATIKNNTAHNNGGGIWIGTTHANGFWLYSGSIINNRATNGDGGAIFVTDTITQNPILTAPQPHLAYPRLRYISEDVDFGTYVEGQPLLSTNNFAGGGGVAPPDNHLDVAPGRFNALLMTNHIINYRSDWRVTFNLNGGNIGGNTSPITWTFQTGWSALARTIGTNRGTYSPPLTSPLPIPPAGPPIPVREGYVFMGWGNLDWEDGDDEMGGTYTVIRTSAYVADHVVVGSTIFVAQWRPNPSFSFHKTNQDIYNDPQWDDQDWIDDVLLSGAHFSVFRYMGTGTPASGIVTQAMIGVSWQLVDTFVSTGNFSTPISFQMTPGRYYQLMETVAPTDFQLPRGQWRITLVVGEYAAPDGFRITAQGTSAIPTFVAAGGESVDGVLFGGTLFVGNLPYSVPPMGITHGGGTAFAMLVVAVLGAGLAALKLYGKKEA